MTDQLGCLRGRNLVAALFLATALTACGGGGGGGNTDPVGGSGGTDNTPLPGQLTYSGVSTQARLDARNSPVIASALLFELGLANGERPLPTGQAQQPRAFPKLSRKAAKASKTNRLTMQAVTTESCPGGGTLRVDDRTNESGIGTATLTYSTCIEAGLQTDGVMVLTVAAYDVVQDEPTDFTASFHGFSESSENAAIDIGGSVHVVSTPQAYTETYDTVTRYRPENVEYRLENMIVRQTQQAQSAFPAVQLQGRMYHSALGYVDVTTDTPLGFNAGWVFVGSGTLRMQGSASASLDVTFIAPNQFRLSLDENGDGTAERALQATGLAQLTLANHRPSANAGEDMTVNEGQTVVLIGSGADWDGNPLAFEWAITGGPVYSRVIGNGTQASFRPTVPGTYLIELRVSDGQPLMSTDTMTLTVTPNADPVAHAGSDVSTVEGATVVLNGGASTDAENDPIQYSWTRISAPAGSTAPATVTGQIWNFVPDRPGVYEYRLTAADATGASYDNVRITTGHLIGFGFSSWIPVDPSTTLASAQRSTPVNVSMYYSGPPVALNVSTNVPWLNVVSAPANTGSGTNLVVGIVPQQVALLANGTHVAQVTVSPVGYTARTVELALNLELPEIEHVTPYVAYEGEAAPVTLYGDALHHTLGGTLLVNGVEVQGFTDSFATHARITLPVLPVGEYDLQVRNNLGIERSTTRFVVREAPTYPDGEVDIQGRIESLEYDTERDAFYIVSWDLDYGHDYQAYRLRYDGTQWRNDPIPVASPQAVSLNVDGTRLYVTSENCAVTELDPDTLAPLQTTTKPSCSYEIFGMMSGLADGRMLVGDTDQWPTVFDYPAFTTVSSPSFPYAYSPIPVLNHTREWLLWAEMPAITGPHELYLYNVAARSFQTVTVHDPNSYFLPFYLAVSGDGQRFMHSADVYEAGQYIGSLQGVGTAYLNPALTREGERAVIFDPVTYRLSVFDLSAAPNFPRLTDVATVPDAVGSANMLRLLPNDSVALLFTTRTTGSNTHVFRVYVRNLP